MNFAEFVAWQEQQRRRPGVIVACETRVHAGLSALQPKPAFSEPPPKVHRCHLATDWARLRQAPAEWEKRALICRGVRHALSLLMRHWARARTAVALPDDVYPVYWQLAEAAQLKPVRFETFPKLQLPDAGVLVLTHPLKLHGRGLDDGEVAALEGWLKADSRRRLVLDAVYALAAPLDAAALKLMATGQTLYLDSLSKGFLHEKVLGVAVVPEADFAAHVEAFRAEPPAPRELAIAAELLRRTADFPASLRDALEARRASLQQRLSDAGVDATQVGNGYFLPLRGDARQLLERHRVLTIPFSVFGREGEWCFASAL
jgi:aspartate/methionine/tyrosine aminotransferase